MRMRLATTIFTVVAIALGGLHFGSATAQADSGVSIVSAANGVAMPWANVIEGADRAFYGASHDGGTGLGAIYRVTPDGSMAVLHNLTRTDGTGPDAPLMQGSDGRLYGTTYYDGGSKRCGTVFAMNTDGSGFTVLHTFGDDRQAEAMPHRDDRFDNRFITWLRADAGHERPVDLQMIDVEAAQIAQRRVPGSEVVHCNRRADAFELPDGFDAVRNVGECHAFGDLDLDAAGIEAGSGNELQ